MNQTRSARSLLVVVGRVGVAAQEFFGVMGVVDVGWLGAVGPGQAAGVGNGGFVVAVADELVIRRAGEEQAVGIRPAVGRPVGAVAHLGVVTRRYTPGARAATVAGKTV